jgi:2-hydroxy-6-oxonona-2,4-dienedioate hydrolase
MQEALQSPQVQRLLASAERLQTPWDDGSVVWHRWGRGAPVVLLHGGSGSWTHWVRNIEALAAAGRQVLVPDLPGFGDSLLPEGARDVDAVPAPLAQGLHILLGDQRADVVGFSFGGMAGGLLAADHAEHVRRLVLVGAPALGVVPRRQVDLKAWRHFKSPERQDEAHRHNLAVLMLHDPRHIDDEALAVHRANVVRDRMPARRLAYTDLLAQALARARCPVHAIYGARDALYHGYLPALAEALPRVAGDFRGLVLIPDGGHWVQYECADAFNAALWAALQDV